MSYLTNKKMEIAREFEDAVIETLISKTKKAIEEVSKGVFWDRGISKTPFDTVKTLIIGGGVIANKALREKFSEFKKRLSHSGNSYSRKIFNY